MIEQPSIDVEELNNVSDPMAGTLRDVACRVLKVAGSRQGRWVKSFVDRVGMEVEDEGSGVNFNGEGGVLCKEVDALKSSLLLVGREDEKVGADVEKLRTQFKGLHYYERKANEAAETGRVDEDGNEVLWLMSEMDSGVRFGERIFYNRNIMNLAVRDLRYSRQINEVFQYMSKNKYVDENENNRFVCEPDNAFFESWLNKCISARDYSEVYAAGQMVSVDVDVPVEKWVSLCVSPIDFETLFKNLKLSDLDKVDKSQLFEWCSGIRNYGELLDFTRLLMEFEIELDDRIFDILPRRINYPMGFGISSLDDFLERFKKIYVSPKFSKVSMTNGWLSFYETVLGRMPEDRA